jgi:hypothetical protein
MLVTRFDYKKLSRKTIDGKRYYLAPDGSKLASVTTIISSTKPPEAKKSLENWKKRVGVERAASITYEASSRGTRMHSFIENYIMNNNVGDSGTNPFSIESHKMAKQVIYSGMKDITEFYGSEISLFYPELYAGTTDMVGLKNNKLILGDFKQTNKPKKREWIEDYFLQLAAYIISHDFLYNTTIEQGIIMMCDPSLKYQEWILDGEELKKYKTLWWNRVYQYYDNTLSK